MQVMNAAVPTVNRPLCSSKRNHGVQDSMAAHRCAGCYITALHERRYSPSLVPGAACMVVQCCRSLTLQGRRAACMVTTAMDRDAGQPLNLKVVAYPSTGYNGTDAGCWAACQRTAGCNISIRKYSAGPGYNKCFLKNTTPSSAFHRASFTLTYCRHVALPAPTITCPVSQVLDASPRTSMTAAFAAPATKGASLDVTCTATSGSTFPLGTTAIACTASQADGQTATCTFSISVSTLLPLHCRLLCQLPAPALMPKSAGTPGCSSAEYTSFHVLLP